MNLMPDTPSTQERATSVYNFSVTEGIKRGLRDFDEGNFMTREESKAVRSPKAWLPNTMRNSLR